MASAPGSAVDRMPGRSEMRAVGAPAAICMDSAAPVGTGKSAETKGTRKVGTAAARALASVRLPVGTGTGAPLMPSPGAAVPSAPDEPAPPMATALPFPPGGPGRAGPGGAGSPGGGGAEGGGGEGGDGGGVGGHAVAYGAAAGGGGGGCVGGCTAAAGRKVDGGPADGDRGVLAVGVLGMGQGEDGPQHGKERDTHVCCGGGRCARIGQGFGRSKVNLSWVQLASRMVKSFEGGRAAAAGEQTCLLMHRAHRHQPPWAQQQVNLSSPLRLISIRCAVSNIDHRPPPLGSAPEMAYSSPPQHGSKHIRGLGGWPEVQAKRCDVAVLRQRQWQSVDSGADRPNSLRKRQRRPIKAGRAAVRRCGAVKAPETWHAGSDARHAMRCDAGAAVSHQCVSLASGTSESGGPALKCTLAAQRWVFRASRRSV